MAAGRKPGCAKTGGRTKGTMNRFSQNLMAIATEKNVDVFEALLEIASDREDKDRFQALKELAQYLYPKRKSLEHSGEIANPYMTMPMDELKKLVKEKLEK